MQNEGVITSAFRQVWFWPLGPAEVPGVVSRVEGGDTWEERAPETLVPGTVRQFRRVDVGRLEIEVERDGRALAARACLPRCDLFVLGSGAAILVVEADFGSRSDARALERPDLTVEDPVGTHRRRTLTLSDGVVLADALRRPSAHRAPTVLRAVWLDDGGRPLFGSDPEQTDRPDSRPLLAPLLDARAPRHGMATLTLVAIPDGLGAVSQRDWAALLDAGDAAPDPIMPEVPPDFERRFCDDSHAADPEAPYRRLATRRHEVIVGAGTFDETRLERLRDERMADAATALLEHMALSTFKKRLDETVALLDTSDAAFETALLALERDTLLHRHRPPVHLSRTPPRALSWRETLGLEALATAYETALASALRHAHGRRQSTQNETSQHLTILMTTGFVATLIVGALGMNAVFSEGLLMPTVRRVHEFLEPGAHDYPHIGVVHLYVHATIVLLTTALGCWLGRFGLARLLPGVKLLERTHRFLAKTAEAALWTSVLLFMLVFLVTR